MIHLSSPQTHLSVLLNSGVPFRYGLVAVFLQLGLLGLRLPLVLAAALVLMAQVLHGGLQLAVFVNKLLQVLDDASALLLESKLVSHGSIALTTHLFQLFKNRKGEENAAMF